MRGQPLSDLAGAVDARRGGRENRRVSEKQIAQLMDPGYPPGA
jgi:hypothetical protein